MSDTFMQMLANENSPIKSIYGSSDHILYYRTNIQEVIPRVMGSTIIDTIIIDKININWIESFDIFCGESILLWNIPFFLSIENIRIIDDEYYIKINQNIFSRDKLGIFVENNFEIPTYKIPYLTFRLNSTKNFNYNLLINEIYYFNDAHLLFPTKYNIYQYETYELNKINKVYSNLICNNIYINTFSPIINFAIRYNGYSAQNIDKNMIIYKNLKKKSLLFSSKYFINYSLPNDIVDVIKEYVGDDVFCYYYSFPIGKTKDSLVNLRNIDSTIIEIKTKDDNYNGLYYLRGLNVLNYDTKNNKLNLDL